MVFIALMELVDIVVITAALGFIFMDLFKQFRPQKHHGDYDPLVRQYMQGGVAGFDWESFRFAALVTAPAVVLHELAHKFMAAGLGYQSVLHASYFFLGLGILMRLMNFRFIFFVPGYVAHSAAALPWQSAMIAGAGPFANLIMWLGAEIALRKNLTHKKHRPLLFLTARINMFLFIFNMIPLGFFDGAKVFSGIIQTAQALL